MAPVTNKYWQPVGNRLLQRAFRVLIPGLEGIDKRAFAGCALLQQLRIALLVGIEVGQEAGGNLHREAGQRHARVCTTCFIRRPGTLEMPNLEHDLHRVRGALWTDHLFL